MDASLQCGSLEMKWTFKDQAKMRKIIELLVATGVKYRVCGPSISFWIAIAENGQIDVVMRSLSN